ncbi:cyclic nucleotide-binding domain protein (macronuclear) [Tetrahymena thermophila SB210]|uniref:Cyclic nucleotide-binding domain protein n=1 Tax=Tetrahymena thermophila (strain SB210) TaxID=312017 RepID=I7M799_TETTS|nr:cyclic nucleotide-binding domain protein [Tetrahymena thermophila SB210]EAR90829.2 cyclic nucleotide-binding domain protein [Tetrahymena thermophila SB210]|eukprot:XP_001011074.2 cyclic nucleotide-binding domain protein [Tetrahymena thermophila SB210]
MSELANHLSQKLQNVKQKLQEKFEEKTEFLKSLELIQRCPSWCRNDIVTKLRSCMVLKTYAKDQIVMDSSLSTFNLYLIYHGEVGCYLDEKYLQKKLTQGQSFGELAYTFNRASKTSFKCHDTCQIYVVMKQDIPTILKDFERQNQAKLTAQVFKQSPFFSDWDLGSVSYLYYLGQMQNYVRNQTVYSQKSETNGIYLIVQGEFSYSIKKKTEKKQIMVNPEGEIDSDQEKIELEKEVFELRTQLVQKTFISKISTMSAGQIFGEEEVLKKICRKYNTTCDSVDGIVIYFNQQVFWSLIYNNPQYKAIVDDKVKKQDIVKQMQINYIKSSMDDYDNYLLGKQYAQNGQELSKIDQSQGQTSITLQKHTSKNGNSEEKSKKKKQQEKDDIKIAIEKIPLLDLKKINDQAKQFNQYSFDPQGEKFNNPYDQDQAENGMQNGNVTSKNMLKIQMRTSSTINNQCQLEFIKMEGQTVYIPSGVLTSKANSNTNHQTHHTFNNNQNNQESPFKQKFQANSQEDLDNQVVSPRMSQRENNNSPRYSEQTQKNKQNVSNNNFMQLPITLNNTQQNTPTNANTNNNQNQLNNGSTHKNSNSSELFDLIMYHNSKKYSKQFTRMKKLIQEGDKMQEMNKKKYSLQNLFGTDRSTPKSVISQIANILKERSQNGQIQNIQNAPLLISQFYTNFQQQNKEQNSQNNFQINHQRSSSQDNLIEVSRQQTLNFLTSNQKQEQVSKQNSPQNIDINPGQDKSKQLQPSSFAQAVIQHSQKNFQGVLLNQKKQFIHNGEDQININVIASTPQQNNYQSQEIQEKQYNHSNSNLNQLLNTLKNNNNEQNLKNQKLQDKQQQSSLTQLQGEENDSFISAQKDQKIEKLTLTERQQKSKTSNSGFRINKSQQQKQIINLQNKILQEKANGDETLESINTRTYHFDKNANRKIKSSTGLKVEKEIFIHQKQNNSSNDQHLLNQKKNSLCSSDHLMIEIDSNVKVTPIEFYNQKKTSVTSNFIDKPHSKDQHISYQQNHSKYNSLQHFSPPLPNSQSIIKETHKNFTNQITQMKDENHQSDNHQLRGQDYILPKNYLKNLRIKSDTSQLQKISKSPLRIDQNLSNSNQQQENQKNIISSSQLVSPRLVLKQTRPLYHDSNSNDSSKQRFSQNKNTVKVQEQLLQKHVQSTFQIQDNKQITSFIQKVIGREDKNKQYIPQQYIISYTSNQQQQQQQSNQFQQTKSFTDLPYLQQQKLPISARHSSTQDKKFYFSKDSNKFRQSLHFDHINKEPISKSDDVQINSIKEKSPNSRQNQICEDLGYNFVKTKIQ